MFSHPFLSEPTLIVTKPQSMKVIRGNDVRFECGVKADVTTPVTTTWMKDKKTVTVGWRYVFFNESKREKRLCRNTFMTLNI